MRAVNPSENSRKRKGGGGEESREKCSTDKLSGEGRKRGYCKAHRESVASMSFRVSCTQVRKCA